MKIKVILKNKIYKSNVKEIFNLNIKQAVILLKTFLIIKLLLV